MKKTYWLLASISIGLLALSNSAFAYLDPGSGAAVVGSIVPLILAFLSAVLAFLVKHFWTPIKRFFSKLTRSKSTI